MSTWVWITQVAHRDFVKITSQTEIYENLKEIKQKEELRTGCSLHVLVNVLFSFILSFSYFKHVRDKVKYMKSARLHRMRFEFCLHYQVTLYSQSIQVKPKSGLTQWKLIQKMLTFTACRITSSWTLYNQFNIYCLWGHRKKR